MNPKIVEGNLLDQKTEAIVNVWNGRRSWQVMARGGISGAIMLGSGSEPFAEFDRHCPLPLGGAVLTGAGHLPYRGIIHVAGVDFFFQPSQYSIRHSVANAIRIAEDHRFTSLAFPVIGAETFGYNKEKALGYMLGEMQKINTNVSVVIVRSKTHPLLKRFSRK